MKKFLLMLVALAFATPAFAGMDKAERSNSNADWVHKPSGNEYVIGRQAIQVRLADVSTASTDYVVVPEAGIITELHCVLDNAITSVDAVVGVNNKTSETSAGVVTVAFTGSYPGAFFKTTGMSTSVTAGSVIGVGTDGGSSTTAITYCTVLIDPAAD